jgi:predicted patatin/cPLA2 family phospholipase
MDEQAGVCIEVVRSRFEPWGCVGGVSAGGCEGSGWHAGQHDLAQDESKCVQTSDGPELAVA